MNFNEFVKKYKITMKSTQVPLKEKDGPWAGMKGSTHWLCTIGVEGYGDRHDDEVTVEYHKGKPQKGKPQKESVLHCLASDINSVNDFNNAEGWVDEMLGGEKATARNVLRMIRAYGEVKEQEKQLKVLFTGFYEEFISCEE